MVSIIIPIYNQQEYLHKCINSVLSQTYSDLEIILVDDGSIDGSGAMCDTFTSADSRISVIHQENKGLSGARNSGLQIASGKYIFFLDADDYLDVNCIEHLLDMAIKDDLDVVQANFYYNYENYLLINCSSKTRIIRDKHFLMRALLKQDYIKNFAWGKLIKTEIAKKNLFPESKYFEDSFWKYKVIHCCDSYGVLSTPLIYYLQRNNGISGTFSIRNLDMIEGNAERIAFLSKNYPDLYYFGLKRFYKEIIQHKKLVEMHLFDEEKAKYLSQLDFYISFYDLQHIFPFLSLIENNKFLFYLCELSDRIISRLFSKIKRYEI